MRFSFSFFSLSYMDSHFLLWKLSSSAITTSNTHKNTISAIDQFYTFQTFALPTILVLSILYLYHRNRQGISSLDLKPDVLQQQDATVPNDDNEYGCHQQKPSSTSRYCRNLQLVLSCILATGWLCCMTVVDVYAAVYFVIWASVVCSVVCV